jgi:hypothetical protein
MNGLVACAIMVTGSVCVCTMPHLGYQNAKPNSTRAMPSPIILSDYQLQNTVLDQSFKVLRKVRHFRPTK